MREAEGAYKEGTRRAFKEFAGGPVYFSAAPASPAGVVEMAERAREPLGTLLSLLSISYIAGGPASSKQLGFWK